MSTFTKNFDFTFPNRFTYNNEQIEFFVDTGVTSVRQFKSGMGQNILLSQIPVIDTIVPSYVTTRLTDGNPGSIFRWNDATSFRFTLPDNTDLDLISVYHEVGTQPYAVVVATSLDGINLSFWYSNDTTDFNHLGHNGTNAPFIATEEGLQIQLDCQRAKYIHVYTAGFISNDNVNPSTNETRIAEIQAFDCIYPNIVPYLTTKETVRFTDFDSINIVSTEDDNNFLQWNIISNGNHYWYDGQEWVAAIDISQQFNLTAEVLANIDTLFRLPTIYDVAFMVGFKSQIGDNTAVLTTLSVTADNVATNKIGTTRVYGTMLHANGMPRTDVYVNYFFEGKTDLTAAIQGSRNGIIIPNTIPKQPTEDDKVDNQGVFYFDLVSNSLYVDPKTKYIFNFYEKHAKNHTQFVQIGTICTTIPQVPKFNLATQVIAVQ